ncbi:hypothetical protein QTP70_015200, partial [Hemibagrus guttatus]
MHHFKAREQSWKPLHLAHSPIHAAANVALEEIALLKINKTVVLTYASIDRSGHAGVCPECCCALRRTERKKVKEREKAMAGETDADILLQSGSVSRNKWKHRTSASSDGLKWKCCEWGQPWAICDVSEVIIVADVRPALGCLALRNGAGQGPHLRLFFFTSEWLSWDRWVIITPGHCGPFSTVSMVAVTPAGQFRFSAPGVRCRLRGGAGFKALDVLDP